TPSLGLDLRRLGLLGARGLLRLLLPGGFRGFAHGGRRAFWLRGARLAWKPRQIARHGGRLRRARTVMPAQEECAGTLELARAAVAGRAGIGENLRRCLAGVDVPLGLAGGGQQYRRNRDRPWRQ